MHTLLFFFFVLFPEDIARGYKNDVDIEALLIERLVLTWVFWYIILKIINFFVNNKN